MRRGIFEMTYDSGYNELFNQIYQAGGMKVLGMSYASQYITSLKHCSLCKNQIKMNYTIICRLLKERGSRFLTCKDASLCPKFQRDEDIIKTRIEILNRYKETHYVDIYVNNG